jgi:hypothetical protein
LTHNLSDEVRALLELGRTPEAFFIPGHEPIVPIEGGFSFRGVGYGPQCDRLWDAISALTEFERFDYLDEDHAFARNRDRLTEWLPTAELDDLCRYLTFLQRGERFGDGLQAEHIRNGNLFLALRRLAELTGHLPGEATEIER